MNTTTEPNSGFPANAVQPFDQRFSFYAAICQQFDNLGTWLVDRLADALSLSVPSDVNNPVRATRTIVVIALNRRSLDFRSNGIRRLYYR